MTNQQTAKFAVIFDMDGVIVDSNPVHRRAWKQFFADRDISLSEEEFRQNIFGRTNEDWMREMFPDARESERARLIHKKEALFREIYADTIALLPGLRTFLDSMQHHGVPMAIATSAPQANADWVLDTLDLEKYFRAILTAKDVIEGKPHPEIYLKTAEALGMAPTSCVVLEDSLSGVKSAKRAGCAVIGVTTTHTSEELTGTDFTINNFTEIDYLRTRKLLFEKLQSTETV